MTRLHSFNFVCLSYDCRHIFDPLDEKINLLFEKMEPIHQPFNSSNIMVWGIVVLKNHPLWAHILFYIKVAKGPWGLQAISTVVFKGPRHLTNLSSQAFEEAILDTFG